MSVLTCSTHFNEVCAIPLSVVVILTFVETLEGGGGVKEKW